MVMVIHVFQAGCDLSQSHTEDHYYLQHLWSRLVCAIFAQQQSSQVFAAALACAMSSQINNLYFPPSKHAETELKPVLWSYQL